MVGVNYYTERNCLKERIENLIFSCGNDKSVYIAN